MTNHGISDSIDRIVTLAKEHKGEVSVAECTEVLGHQSILLAILFFALINSLPIPGIPGVSTVTGLPIILLAWQLVRGKKALWLPKRITRHKLHSKKLFKAMEKTIPWLRATEKRMKRRFPALCEPPFSNTAAAVIIVLAGLLALPVPFLNFPMGISITVITLGLLARDGLVTAIGLVMGGLAICLLPVLLLNGADLIGA